MSKSVLATDNYKLKMAAVMEDYINRNGVFKIGEIYHTIVLHDDWCGIYSGNRCNCDPEIEILTDKQYQERI
jgi:hypothetical protein